MDKQPSISNNFLSFPGCKACFARPCEGLRFGRIFPGKFIFIHRRNLGFGDKGCPFVPNSFNEVHELLRDVSLQKLIRSVNDILFEMSPMEQLRINMQDFVDSYDDFSGRIRFLSALWDSNVLGVVCVPQFFQLDRNLSKWLLVNESLDYQMRPDVKQQPEEKAAVTDSMVQQPEQATKITEMKDEKKIEKGDFHIRLNIDPNNTDSQDDTFTLFSTDSAKSYNKVLTVKDDQIPGDSYTDLSFIGLDKSLSYSLKISLGNGGQSYLLIDNKPYGELHG